MLIDFSKEVEEKKLPVTLPKILLHRCPFPSKLNQQQVGVGVSKGN
jgi:hypothetical protein